MMWDFRNLIRRGAGRWPRDWHEIGRPPARPPRQKREDGNRISDTRSQQPDDVRQAPVEHWLAPPWQPQEGSADAWKEAE